MPVGTTDPPGTLTGENDAFDGNGSQTDTGNRWGDYSAMTVDPVDDCTFCLPLLCGATIRLFADPIHRREDAVIDRPRFSNVTVRPGNAG